MRETELLVARMKLENKPHTKVRQAQNVAYDQLNTLAQRLHTQVKVKDYANGSGQLIIHYSDHKNLEQLLEQLGAVVEI